VIAHLRHWLGRTLTRKFTLLLAGFLALQALQLGAGLYGLLHISEEASGLVNEAGRQRYRTLMLGTLARRAVSEGAWTAEGHGRFVAVWKEYERYFVEFERRAAKARKSPQVQSLLAEARAGWEKELRPLLSDLDPARPEPARAALRRYEVLAPEQVARLDRIVNLLDEDIVEDIHGLALFSAAVLALSLALGLIGLGLARYVVSLPLKRFTEATAAIAAGAYDRRVDVRSRDELGELAENFNRMAGVVGERTSQLGALNRVALAITSTQGLKETLDEIMRRGIELTGSKAACIAFCDQEAQRFNEWVTRGLSRHFVKNMVFRPGGLADEAFTTTTTTTTGTYVLSNDRPETKHKLSKLARDEGLACFLCLPLTSHASRLGVIYFYRADRDIFAAEEIELLTTFARLAAEAIENARLQARTEEQARTDALTGLPNRRELERRLDEELKRAQRYRKALSVLLLDIDRFKKINDTYGHPAGDAVLKRFVQIIGKQVRDVDFAGRYGGEEFLFLLPETDGRGAKLVAERIRRAVAGAPFELPDGKEIAVTASIGIACFPACAATAAELVARADQALYLAKQTGRNRVVLYREMLTAELERNPQRIVELLNESLVNIQTVVTSIEAKAEFYRAHNHLVEQAAARLARALALPPNERETLRLAAVLHDIGVAIIPDWVLNKTAGLTPEEWALLKQHPVTAANLLEQVPALTHVAPVVRHHHERYDGSGYPDGLKGEATPYLARVLAVADNYAALTADWVGSKARKPEEITNALAAGAGMQLDPAIVEAFLKALDQPAGGAAAAS
jgi:diguanylate cyclase (GGDEF)-like protein